MATGTQLLYNNVTYLNDSAVNIIDIVAAQNIVAIPDESNVPKSLYIGASKDVTIQAFEDVNIALGSTNTLTVNDYSSNNSLMVVTDATSTTLHAGAKDLVLGNSNDDLYIGETFKISKDSNYQVLSTTQQSGFKFDDSMYVVGSQLVGAGLSVGGNIICNSNVFSQNYNLYRQRTGQELKMVGYAFTINDKDQLELIKFSNFSNNASSNQVTKKVAVFGQNALRTNDASDANYVEFDGLGINFINGSSGTAVAGVDGSIADGAVTTAKLADNSVTTSKIMDANVTSVKIAPGAILSDKIALSNITEELIDKTTVGVWEVYPSTSNIYYDNGSVGIHTTPRSQYVLDIVGDAHIEGTFSSSAPATQQSDYRLKTDIEPIKSALQKIEQINGYTYAMKADPERKRCAGVIAQELQKVLPEVVHEHHDGFLSVAYANIVSLLIEGIKELNAKFAALQPTV